MKFRLKLRLSSTLHLFGSCCLPHPYLKSSPSHPPSLFTHSPCPINENARLHLTLNPHIYKSTFVSWNFYKQWRFPAPAGLRECRSFNPQSYGRKKEGKSVPTELLSGLNLLPMGSLKLIKEFLSSIISRGMGIWSILISWRSLFHSLIRSISEVCVLNFDEKIFL